MTHHAVQLGLLAFGAAGAWLISGPAGSPWITHGFALLLVSQVFWLLDVFSTRPIRWGVLVNVVFYTAIWIRGLVNYY